MAETVIISSDSEPETPPRRPFPKRRRILTSAPIPVYSTQVERGLKLLDNPMELPAEIKARCSSNLPFSSEEDEDEEKPIPLKQLKSRPSNSLSTAKKSSLNEVDEDDVVLLDVVEPQELLLKVRCRHDLYKVCVLMTEPLRRVVDYMSMRLKIDPNRIILQHHDHKLSFDATPAKLNLGVSSIIDCVVETEWGDGSGNLLLRM